MNSEIQIIDVIVTYGLYGGGKPRYHVLVSRLPDYVYVKDGIRLTAHDSGFYDFLGISAGSKDAFGGRKFDIRLSDGTTYHCSGQVWACGSSASEPVVNVGIGTVEDLHKCYVFSGGYISKAKLDAWLATNKPSRNYYKYDPTQTIEWLDQFHAKHHYAADRTVCAKRARKLRRRGVTIRIEPGTGKRSWSPYYERRKAEILKLQAMDAA